MLKIWGRKNSLNVHKVLWTCAELGVKYERIDAGKQYGVNDTPEYLAMNPNGLVPTIDDGGFILWESHAIVRYLARKYGDGTLWPSDLRACADADRWMEWYSTTLGPHLWVVFRNLLRTPPGQRDMAAVEGARKALIASFDIANNHLQSRSYMTGAAFTMADILVGVGVYRWFVLPIERPSYPNLHAYYERLKHRSGYKEIVALPLS